MLQKGSDPEAASSDPPANGIEYDDNGTLPSGVDIDPSTGDITGTPDTVAEYYVVITATDSVTAASISTASVTVDITDGYDARGFDANGYHRNGTIYDDEDYDIDGYNRYGFNAADEYDPLYDENVSRT